MSSNLSCEIDKVDDFDSALRNWSSFESAEKESVFFSDLWMSAWLKLVLSQRQVYLLKVFDSGLLVGLAFVCKLKVRRRLLFSRNVVFFNEFPESGFDMTIEYNGLLVKSGYLECAWPVAIAALQDFFDWDEIQLRAISKPSEELFRSFNMECSGSLIFDKASSDRIALLPEQEKWSDVEASLLSKNKKRQLRVAKGIYTESLGEVGFYAAETLDESLQWFEAMGLLHNSYWQSKGEKGSFSNPLWVEFHKTIITSCFNSNNILLVKICAGETVVGYLYNLIWQNEVYNIQSGFFYESDNRRKPGFLSHLLALEYCHSKKVKKYHFLAGSEPYKKSISNMEFPLYWLTIQKKTVSIYLENLLVYLVRALKTGLSYLSRLRLR